MKKCDYCDEKIGLFSNTWLDKKKDLIVHDTCLEEWHIKYQNKQKTLEKLTKIDYKTLSEKQRLEIQEIIDEIFKDIDKDWLYSLAHTPKWISDEESIRALERFIEDVKKNENYPDKEETLKTLNDMLKILKQKGIIFSGTHFLSNIFKGKKM
jgi:uncharacterized protein (DUF885 family)